MSCLFGLVGGKMVTDQPQPQRFSRYQISQDLVKYIDWILEEVYSLRFCQKDFTAQFIESVYHQWRSRHWLALRQLDALEAIFKRSKQQGEP